MNKILNLIKTTKHGKLLLNVKLKIMGMLNKEPKIKLRWYTYVERLHGTTVKTSSTTKSVTFVEKL